MLRLKMKKSNSVEVMNEFKAKLERNHMKIIDTIDAGEYYELIVKENMRKEDNYRYDY